MKLLLVDIGNTRVKWAWLKDGRLGRQHAAVNTAWRVQDYARRIVGGAWITAGDREPLRRNNRQPHGKRYAGRRFESEPRARILVSSVAGARVGRMLVAAARKMGAPPPVFFVSRRRVGGIVTSYLEPWRLGVDRLVGVVGAWHLAGRRAACVVNIGTAITIDLVDSRGQHRGGAIIPGPALMVKSLLQYTSGIRRRAQGGAQGVQSLFARSTRTAIAQGSRYAAAAVIDRAILEASQALGRRPKVFLTGGGAAAVKPLMRARCVTVPDLVLVGLAAWAGQASTGRRLN